MPWDLITQALGSSQNAKDMYMRKFSDLPIFCYKTSEQQSRGEVEQMKKSPLEILPGFAWQSAKLTKMAKQFFSSLRHLFAISEEDREAIAKLSNLEESLNPKP